MESDLDSLDGILETEVEFEKGVGFGDFMDEFGGLFLWLGVQGEWLGTEVCAWEHTSNEGQ